MPMTFAVVVCSTLFLVAAIFFVYDWIVQRRNQELAASAARSEKVVASLFPGDMKDMVLGEWPSVFKCGQLNTQEDEHFQNPIFTICFTPTHLKEHCWLFKMVPL